MTLDLEEIENMADTCDSGGHVVPAATVRALVGEVRALRKDKERLDSGCIMTSERDEFGESYKCERRGNDLRKMIDEAMAAVAREREAA